ncbi:MAG TPA: YggS family pyridoxal phosphate-dependent enzyme [Parvularculaceae bacterium]|nr:YggS family pyridoxal phosphate-dependent enzyme [Caulobacterales bacterium]HPE30351.1 YggS family pyridoxal phosphate-dependent enzyme [Parvularculaceae bacterium]HRX39232.1 YggS family pyridoxal phosphate-dependent enzyme [Parvularculaceae bacterium]
MPDATPADPVANLARIRARLNAAAEEAGRKPEDITVIAVSKNHGAEAILPLLEAGHRVFGENRVQEAMGKWPALKERYPDIELHLIGPLQTNKAKEAVAFFDVIETVDRPKLARILSEEMARQGKTLRLLVQVNTGEEEQKAGAAPQEADAFIAQCRDEYGLAIDGLMCIPPAEEAPAPHFALLAKIAARNGLKTLSMGMSGDYEIAATLGATHVRVGTEIFGARAY